MSKLGVAFRNAPLVLRGIYEYNIASHFGPLPAREWMFPLTYRCNARCIMCNIWQSNPDDELSTEEWNHILADRLFASVESVSLTGGEPTLRADLPQLAELLVKKLPTLRRITLTTNALNTQRVVSHCQQLADLCATHGISFFVGISLDGIGTVHDEMRNVPGAFDKVVHTIEELKRLSGRGRNKRDATELRLGVNCTLTGRNLHDADNVRLWCAERGLAVNFIVASFAESYYNNIEAEAELTPSPQQRQKLATFLRQLAAQKSWNNLATYFYADAARMITQGTARNTPCVFQKDAFILDARGDMQYCMYSRLLGNVRQESAQTIYHAPQNLVHRQEIIADQCRKCTITCFLELGLAKDALKYTRFLLRGLS